MAPETFGPYTVYEQIGIGGMATVHRAETRGVAGFRKQVALKRMLPSVAADANLVQSFIREARLASHLRHANVAQTYDLGKVGDIYFIAMELVPGRTLRHVLKHCAALGVHMPLAMALNIVNQIADALDYAHNLCDESGAPLGIIHRDVSPSNIIVSEGGIVKLIDFGIAKAASSGGQTLSGTVKGKFSYMAPEYLLDGKLDARADLFALGVIAHELLVGKPLFQGRDDMETLFRIRDLVVAPPSRVNREVPAEIDAIIMTALDRDPEKRWQRASAMRMALTHETMKLGLVAHNTQVLDWIDWAFEQTPVDDDAPEISISSHTTERPAPRASEPPAARPSLPTVNVRPQSPSQPPRSALHEAATVMYPNGIPPADPHGERTVSYPDGLPPLVPPSGARTQPFMPQQPAPRPTLLGVGPDAQRTSAQPVVVPAPVGNPYILGVLVLIAAGAAAAVVYFAMP
ncbi:MAG: protein kinase [Kofleriaceae bacterium]|nr:protein kinase [Kofleriaceae bacterium]